MKQSTPVRLAIVGSGSIAQTHAIAISQLPEAQLVAVCARNETKARELQGHFTCLGNVLIGFNFSKNS